MLSWREGTGADYDLQIAEDLLPNWFSSPVDIRRTKYAYAHIGQLHSDQGRKSGLMYVALHETSAAPDAYAAGRGWLSGRSATVIPYSMGAGEDYRSTLQPEMLLRMIT
ncbi:hypothetical protein [Aureimonas fodinaquatilis]|uniref:hypothetical protein n=1 Tax=Aureimonas fodinaquatilis TaxID=2565783 RepID=UPI001AED9B16|nr:hypothetical protein [Aureimonas fodinaquatilis]